MSVDEQFEQAVKQISPFLCVPEPAATSITHSLLMTVHFRDYLEAVEEARRIHAGIHRRDDGFISLECRGCRMSSILARIDAHATEAT